MRLLLSGLDTVEAAYYFRPLLGCRRISPPLVKPVRHSAHLSSVTRLLALGAKEFLLAGDGTASGYRFENLQARQPCNRRLDRFLHPPALSPNAGHEDTR